MFFAHFSSNTDVKGSEVFLHHRIDVTTLSKFISILPPGVFASKCDKNGALFKAPWKQRISDFRHQTQMKYYGFDNLNFFNIDIEPEVRKHHRVNEIEESQIPAFYPSQIKCALQEHPFRYLNYSKDLWNEIVRATPRQAG